MQGLSNNPSNTTPNFKARIVKNSTVNAYLKYVNEHLKSTGSVYNTRKNLELWNKICDAFEKHPSKEEINTAIVSKRGLLYGSRGVLETSKGCVVDTEPARSDSWAPLENVIKRILHPDNRSTLNELLGEKKQSVTDKWWKENIAPIWNEIKDTFTEPTLWAKEHIDHTKNIQWNKEFREQNLQNDYRKIKDMSIEKFD